MRNKFISIASFYAAADAAIARGLLESGGIACRALEEKLSPNSPYYKGVGGKWWVQVQRKNLLQALRVLKEKGRLRSEDFCVAKWKLFFAKALNW
ncbi:MAG: hypothetical protein LBU92_03455 [Prevotellaceae bacterium]|jgi:hypothetical protein|nr:hypothetical protein [Prevotellaceae bacterium]